MGKVKAATLAQAPIAIRRQVAIDPTDSRPPKQVKPAPPRASRTPDKFTYSLKQYTAERRKDGWWVARTPFGDERPSWSGPFPTIEEACLAIARLLAAEIANRHSAQAASHNIKSGDPLYGLKPTTRLKPRDKSASTC
jgi:hypothetical protein